MIRLRLKFSSEDNSFKIFPSYEDEVLSHAIDRATADVPGQNAKNSLFIVVMNGKTIPAELWPKVNTKKDDDILITPRIQSGEGGQIFKQFLILAVAITAAIIINPAAGFGFAAKFGGALAVAGVTLGATLALNALIPPPMPELGGFESGEGPESSQTYTVTGQSNQLKRLGSVPKVYGSHRIFPPLAANPYTELAVDPATGETIQYYCAIYDFGLGSPAISDIKIGDTPLTTDSFEDFQYRLVDPNRPATAVDAFDEPLNQSFILYRGDRTVTPLSVVLTDGSENIQNADENPDSKDQEIVLDLVCPRGLFGYSSGGTLGSRTINLQIEFALVGSSTWRSYNDTTYVDSFRAVGGTDQVDFTDIIHPLLPGDAAFNTFYHLPPRTQWTKGGYTRQVDGGTQFYLTTASLKAGSQKLAMVKTGRTILAGTRILLNERLVGVVVSVTDRTTYWEVTLDRDVAAANNQYLVFHLLVRDITAFSILTTTYTQYGPTAFFVVSAYALGTAAITGSSTNPVYASIRFTPKDVGEYKVRVRRVDTTGPFSNQTSDDLTWGAITTNFVSQPILTTKRHVFMELRIRSTDQLNGSIQNLSAVAGQPVDVYDEGTSTWSREISDNPAWVFCDLLTGEVNKKAVAKSRLDMTSILAWAEYCDEVPTSPPSQEFLEPRFKTNFILDYATTLQEVLNSVAGAAQSSLNIIDGKYGVLVDRLKTVPVQIFTPRNCSQFSSSRFYAPRPHALKIKYIDPNRAWEVSEITVYDNGYDENNATEFEEMTSFACTNHEQAWRFGRYMIAQNRLRQETISIQVDFENLICTRGDYVQLSQDVMQVGGRPARVIDVTGNVVTLDDSLEIDPEIVQWGYTYRGSDGTIATSTATPLTPSTFDLDGTLPDVGDLIVIGESGSLVIDCIVKSISPNDDLSAQLVLVERANEIFAYESTDVLPDYDPQISSTSNPDSKPPTAVTDLAVEESGWECSDTQSGYRYYAALEWNIPAGSIYELFEIWYNNGAGYRAVATTTAKSYNLTLDSTRIGTTMGAKVVAVSATGKKLNLIEVPEVTFATALKTTPPSDVTGFGVSITQQVLQLKWDPLEDCDVFRYEVRFSPISTDIWEATVPLQIVDRNVNSLAVQARTGIYYTKAIDFAGNKSTNASSVITSIPDLFGLNIIDSFNDAPGFVGEKDRVEVQTPALILQEEVSGTVDTMEYYSDGYYTLTDLVDLGEIYSARLQSSLRSHGFVYGELMSTWDPLSEVGLLAGSRTEDWNVVAEYRATPELLVMASWLHLYDVPSLGEGAGDGFTDWRPIPTIGDATGRVFQFRIHLQSFKANVTPRLFDATISIDMPDRIDTLEDLLSTASGATQVDYTYPFAGPGTSPNIQISIQDGASGDYWTFANKTLVGFEIRFYDNTNTQVVRTFDVAAKGYGRRHTVTI